MSHIFLIGFMGAGKTTVARLLADRLNRPCVDVDDIIEASAGRSVRAIFEDEGEVAFRALESEALLSLESAQPSVVACGGGIVLRDENRSVLKRLGCVVYLKVSAGETLARVGADGTRPLLSGPGGVLAATSLLEARETLYAAVADVSVDTVGLSADQVASQIVSVIEGLCA
ncbi:MAG: shikimate kinase [Coriobacteriia bacterium]|nr:shikimate kinase [Coriobacteriia bacterium]